MEIATNRMFKRPQQLTQSPLFIEKGETNSTTHSHFSHRDVRILKMVYVGPKQLGQEYGRSSNEYEDYEDNEDGEEYEEEEENSEEFHPHYICTLQFPVGLKSSIFFHMLTSLLQRNIQKDKHGMKL
ncbi:hypothetical protein D8674_008167 [Pyrus ussuriensis x Pyrus communis]|uniref:Uncharacterized protein n=1 Tax=Pyrus ussuriensis x Pyrus communis TaxID=2448454 RepID=A0A5N5HSX2_9ROSA|nr:hypothetical protein D8674_008167 [Pyrus ussuriensis x Pyrus communis]